MRCKLIEGTQENLKATVTSLGVRGKMDLKPVITVVQDVIDDIRENGDEALLKYTEKFDKVKLTADQLRVTEKEIEDAIASVDPELLTVMKKAASNIRRFHEEQKEHGFMMDCGKGSKIGVRVRPISIAGIYVPGGTAPLPSTVLMDVIPASVAGVERIVFATPPRKDGTIAPVILAAASIAGATEIYRMGGSQAIAAMAYGTETVPRVDKICGPGNIYVNTAKRLVFGQVDIDMFAGPSEILIIADKTANPDFVAADMLSQAEHDKMASAIVLTDSRELAEKILECADRRSEMADRKEILVKSMEDYCAIIVCDSLDTAIDFSEEIAPEHLELCVENPELLSNKINNCGAMFLGNYSPEPLGDYFAGPNHTLPTSGTARFFSPLNTGDFYKKMSVINYNEEMLRDVYKDVAAFADSEGLSCHAAAVRARFED
ncbi:histidinol dehydrogenase [Butyrivibrio sp. AE2032]|uniref:histidinol dehydrogenase n=1 Tax=Butyrivibrio sp. AE2032 TaxID=1458463 RepID=UPI000558FA0B|nr:histidinol dehydrogenase [Butyrivibrio sp. AE2032]